MRLEDNTPIKTWEMVKNAIMQGPDTLDVAIWSTLLTTPVTKTPGKVREAIRDFMLNKFKTKLFEAESLEEQDRIKRLWLEITGEPMYDRD